MSYQPLLLALKGGAGSGNFGHAGRPGKHGGSAPGRSLAPDAGSITKEPTTPPPPGPAHAAKIEHDTDGDGVTDMARVGVPADAVPPPPGIPRIPYLTAHEREAEGNFIKAFEADPDGMAKNFLDVVKASAKPGEPLTFGTDDAKVLTNVWSDPNMTPEQRAINRATLNTPLHQTANAIAKRAFVQHLDTLKPGDELMVTVGGCGCHAAGTSIIMLDGSTKFVEDIQVGEQLLGPDSKPRNVLKLIRGHGRLYRVTPKRGGESFIVNEDHVLSVKFRVHDRACGSLEEQRVLWRQANEDFLKHRNEIWSPEETKAMCTRIAFRTPEQQQIVAQLKGRKSELKKPSLSTRQVVNITVKDWLKKSKKFQTLSVLYRVGVEFEEKPVPLDPYYLGLWLGDGTHSMASITTADAEIVAYLQEFTKQFPEARLVVNSKSVGNAASDYRISLINPAATVKGTGGRDANGVHIGGPLRIHPILTPLRQLNVYKNKHIPQLYLTNSRTIRLELLAGLIDSDGHYNSGGFGFGTKYKHLAEQVAYLARSLGFGATLCEGTTVDPWSGIAKTYYGTYIGGNNLQEIPTKLPRKQAKPRPQVRSDGKPSRNVLHTHYTIEYVGMGDYYGFTLDKDHLYLLGDFTVTHNSGKGYALKNVPDALDIKGRSKAVWDSAGDQNATENTWIQKEAEKRGLKVNYVFVHADPKTQWAHPERGVVKRAADPSDGRMVDAKVFADSYALGARNHQAFYEKNQNNPNANFIFLENAGKPKQLPGIPQEALNINRKELAQFAANAVKDIDAPAHVKRGATMGERIWGDD